MTRGEFTAARMCSSAHRRRHRRSLVAATLIVAFSGAVFLATVAGARRSDSAFARMKVETRAAQLRVFGPAIDDATLDRLRALPGVVDVGRAQQLVANVIVVAAIVLRRVVCPTPLPRWTRTLSTAKLCVYSSMAPAGRPGTGRARHLAVHSPAVVTRTTHVHPEALHYVSDLRHMLLAFRVGMDIALIPPPTVAPANQGAGSGGAAPAPEPEYVPRPEPEQAPSPGYRPEPEVM